MTGDAPEMLTLLTYRDIKRLELEIPEMMAMSMFLLKYSDSQGNMEEILNSEEIILSQKEDNGFKTLCDLLLTDPVTPVKVDDVGTGLSRKKKLSIEIDRANMWKNMYRVRP